MPRCSNEAHGGVLPFYERKGSYMDTSPIAKVFPLLHRRVAIDGHALFERRVRCAAAMNAWSAVIYPGFA